MLKLIGHAVVFAVGAGLGVYWGVHHPTEAANVSDIESAKVQQAVALAKQQVLQQVVNEQNSDQGPPAQAHKEHLSKYQQMLQSAQQDLDAAKTRVNGQ